MGWIGLEEFHRVNLKLENGYEIKSLTRDKIEIVEGLNEKCLEYYLLHEGVVPSSKEAAEIFSALPPGKGYEDKFVLGIFKESGKLTGLIDIVRDYPIEGEWMLGLLLIHPDERGRKLGKSAHEALAQWAVGFGARCFRIGVVEENCKGKKFWTGIGYEGIKKGSIKLGNKTHRIDMTLQTSSG